MTDQVTDQDKIDGAMAECFASNPVKLERTCKGAVGECNYNGACMYACGLAEPPKEELTFATTVARAKVIEAARTLRGVLAPSKRRAHREAWAVIETYLDVSLRVVDKTPFDQVKSAAVTGEIKARLHGRAVE